MNIAILGAGQLGGSLALALKEARHEITITAYDTIASHTDTLVAMGAIDQAATSPADAVRDADIIIFAAPLSAYRSLATAIAPVLKKGSIVTDLGSVKGSMVALTTLLPNSHLVPGHPIAGSEKSGPQAARGDLFQNRICVLTPDDKTDADALAIVETLWHAAGADVIQMPATVHDQIYAYVSHLPHYIAFVAASYFHRLGITLLPQDTMLQQFLRISRSNTRMWTDIAIENRESFLPVLATYTALLEHFATELRAGEKTDTPDTTAIARAFLPRILAASLISSVSLYEQQSGLNLRPFGAGGMRDIVAPAAHAPEEDTQAISHAAPIMADHIDAVVREFRTLEQLIGAEASDALFTHISAMIGHAHLLVTPRN